MEKETFVIIIAWLMCGCANLQMEMQMQMCKCADVQMTDEYTASSLYDYDNNEEMVR